MPVLKKPPVAERQYANFLGCSLGHVVVEALKLVFNKDREFQKWVSENAESEGKQPELEELQTAEQDTVQPIRINPRKQTC